MESRADFDGGICCVARADPMIFVPEERMTCDYLKLTEVEFDYIENEELIAHIIQLDADVPKVRVTSNWKHASVHDSYINCVLQVQSIRALDSRMKPLVIVV